jgi:HK97 gp10 family phage protein
MTKYKGISIIGLKKFQSDIDRAKDHLKNGGLYTAMVKSVHTLKNNTQPITPYKTGTLRKSLWTNVTNNGMRGELNQDSNQAAYGIFVEMGTKRMQPRYFMAQGLERSISAIEKFFSELLGQVVKIMAD